MYAILKFKRNSLTALESTAVANAILDIVCGSSLSAVSSIIGDSTLLDIGASVVQDNPSDRWTKVGNQATSPCAAPNQSKLKYVSFDSNIANRINMNWGNGITQLTDLMDFVTTVASKLIVSVTPHSIFIGNFGYNAAGTAGTFALMSEFKVSGTSSHYGQDANLFPVLGTRNTLTDLTNTSTITNNIRLFNAHSNVDTIANTVTAGYLIGDNSGQSAWINTRSTGRDAQYVKDMVYDALLPIGVNYPGTTTAHAFCASITDMSGIYFHQGCGNNWSAFYTPDDILHVDSVDYSIFNRLAIPLN